MLTKSSLPTQQLLAIERIEHDTLIVQGGGLRKLVLVSGLNFELRSDEEQGVALGSYQNFLNALDFPLQIFIHSRKINIDGYIAELTALEHGESNTLLASLVGEYRAFVASLVAQNPIMEKRFFVVVPYDLNPLAATGATVIKKILGLFQTKEPTEEPTASPTTNPSTETPKTTPESAFIQLDQRVDQVISGLTQLGLRAVALNKEEITELFYNLYNPETVERHVVPSEGIENRV